MKTTLSCYGSYKNYEWKMLHFYYTVLNTIRAILLRTFGKALKKYILRFLFCYFLKKNPVNFEMLWTLKMHRHWITYSSDKPESRVTGYLSSRLPGMGLIHNLQGLDCFMKRVGAIVPVSEYSSDLSNNLLVFFYNLSTVISSRAVKVLETTARSKLHGTTFGRKITLQKG